MFYKFCQKFCKILLKLFYRLKITGKQNIPEGPAIIACNHVSYLDPIIVAAAFPSIINFLGRSSLFNNWFFGKLISTLRCHPIKKGQGNLQAFKKIISLLQNGEKVLLFPEGTRSKTGKIQKGAEGIGTIVKKTKVVVIPVYVDGSFDIWDSKRKFPKLKGRVSCNFGKPLYFDDEDLSKQDITDLIMKEIKNLEKQYKRNND